MDDDARRHLEKLIAETDMRSLTLRSLAFARFMLAARGMEIGPRGKSVHRYTTQAVFEVLDGRHYPHQARSLFALVAGVIARRDVGVCLSHTHLRFSHHR